MEIGDRCFRHYCRKDDDGADPQIEGHYCKFDRQHKFLFCSPFIDKSECPCGKERSQQKWSNTAKDEEESGPESHVSRRVDERESGRYNNRRCEIGEEREGSEVLYRTTHLTGNDRCGSSGRHDETHKKSLRENGISGKTNGKGVGNKTERELREENNPMPFMQAQIEGIHLTKRKKEHAEDEPREGWLQGQEESITEGTDEHREP